MPKNPIRAAALVLACASSPFQASPAEAVGEDLLRLEVLVDGVPLRELAARGTTYVEALRGREYAVRLTNLEPVRVAVALAVDGRNTIDGARGSASAARKWILSPGQTVVLDGWQSSADVAHRFVFTSEEASHAAWLGDASAAGIIEAVAYRERQPEPPPLTWIPWLSEGDSDGASDGAGGKAERADRLAPRGAAADAPSPSREAGQLAPTSAAPAELGAASALRQKKSVRDEARENEGPAATGFGRELEHRVTRISFDAEPSPSSRVRLRYEYRDALVRLGVLPRAEPRDTFARRESAHGFVD